MNQENIDIRNLRFYNDNQIINKPNNISPPRIIRQLTCPPPIQKIKIQVRKIILTSRHEKTHL